jgi:dTDP-L-rhamnose 4-epimerase
VGPTGVTHVEVHRAGDIEHACADLTRLLRAGAPAPARSTAEAVTDFIRHSWDRPGAASSTWDAALDELARRGLTS